MDQSRYERGIQLIKKLAGKNADQFIAGMNAADPDLCQYTIEFAYGDVLSRPGLDLKSREIATVAALTALGTARSQLAAHIQVALAVGCTQTEIMEIMIQMAVYAGFPAAFNGIAAAKEVFSRLTAPDQD